MQCPFCKSDNVEVPTVDIGVGEQQCGPAFCLDCNSSQDNKGRWVKYELEPIPPGAKVVNEDGEDDFDFEEDSEGEYYE